MAGSKGLRFEGFGLVICLASALRKYWNPPDRLRGVDVLEKTGVKEPKGTQRTMARRSIQRPHMYTLVYTTRDCRFLNVLYCLDGVQQVREF